MFSCLTQSVLAQVATDDFTIRVFGGTDLVAPTTPVLLTATPVALSQINITWSASTDNIFVSGYSVLRNGLPIATTSLLSFSDTSLSASTTYTYAVRAFDASYNYSSTSNSLSATTFSIAPPGPSSGGNAQGEGTVAKVVLDQLTIETGVSTTSFALQTAHQARLELRWGRTASYELGYVVSNQFSKTHTVLLTDLEPGARYEYELVGHTPFGIQTVLKRGVFTTVSPVQKITPANVSRFKAVGMADDVELSWEIPTDDAISQVRIVRSHLGFPQYPQDGAVVYQGLKTTAWDEKVLAQYSPVYYTAFVYDTYGNVSSGAVAIVYATLATDGAKPPEMGTQYKPNAVVTIGDTLAPTEDSTSTIFVDRLTVDMKMPNLSDITLLQGDKQFTFVDPDITLDSKTEFTISLPKKSVAGNLKSIIATVVDPTDNHQTYSFLLRINKESTAYEAEIAPLLVSGESQLVLEIYDYEAFVVGTYQAPLIFTEEKAEVAETVAFPDALFRYWPQMLIVVLILICLLIIYFLGRRYRGEDNE